MTDDSNRDFSGAVNQSPGMNEREGVDDCHCGKDGHALNSINCPVHGSRRDQLREALESIAGWRKVNIAGEYEHGLRDIIRSITDCAAAALDAAPAPSAWQPITVTDEMVESGLAAWMICEVGPTRRIVRTILEAALSPLPSSDRGGVG